MSDFIREFITGVTLGRAKTDDYLNMCVDSGWHPLIKELIGKLEKLDPELRIEQVKEKFGGLRFYTGTTHVAGLFDIISEYEKKSYTICEKCGKKGKLRDDIGWYKTLCTEHYKEKLTPKRRTK